MTRWPWDWHDLMMESDETEFVTGQRPYTPVVQNNVRGLEYDQRVTNRTEDLNWLKLSVQEL